MPALANQRSTCEVDDCLKSTHSGSRYCAGHAKRFELGQAVNTPLRERLSLRERVQQLAIDLAEVDSEDDDAYEKAWDALEHAVKCWERNQRQRRAGKARWKGMTAAERKEFMRRAQQASAAARRAVSQANTAGKGSRRAPRRGSP